MREQWKEALNLRQDQAPASRADRKDLPVETDTGRVYNGSAGKKVGALTGKENRICDVVDNSSNLIGLRYEMSEHRNEIEKFIDDLLAQEDQCIQEPFDALLLKED